MDPCLELNLFHDSANLPRLALRLRLRLSALSSRSEQPRSISPASLHFLPMLSPRGRTGRWPCSLGSAGCSRRSALYCAAFAWSAPAGAQRSVRPPAGCACARDWLNWGWGCERHLRPSPLPYAPQIAFHPQLPPSRGEGEGGTQPTPGAVDALWEFLEVPAPRPVSRPLRPGSRSLGHPLVGGWRLQLN